jgi:hypothetical protein
MLDCTGNLPRAILVRSHRLAFCALCGGRVRKVRRMKIEKSDGRGLATLYAISAPYGHIRAKDRTWLR